MNTKKKSTNHADNSFSNFFYAIFMLFQASPAYGFGVILESLRHQLTIFLGQTICLFYVLKGMEDGKGFSEVTRYIILFAVIDLISALLKALYEKKIKKQYLPLAQEKLQLKLYNKAKDIDLACYDDPIYYKEYLSLVPQGDLIIERSARLLKLLCMGLTTLFCYGTFFWRVDTTSGIFVLIAFGIQMVMEGILKRFNKRAGMQEERLKRRQESLQRIFYQKEYAVEMCLNHLASDTLHKEFDHINEEIYKQNEKNGKKRFYISLFGEYIGSEFLLTIILGIYLAVQAGVNHQLSYAAIAVLLLSARKFRKGLGMLAEIGNNAVETNAYMQKVRKLLSYQNKIVDHKTAELTKESGIIEFQHVRFGYDKNNPILINICLKIKPQESIAFVGNNSEAKSALIKLLLRLYDPDDGEIFLNGVNIKEFSLTEYRRYIGVVFKDSRLFAASAGENVVMDKMDDHVRNEIDSVLFGCGFAEQYKKLSQGYETILTKEIDPLGTVVTGDDAKKIFMARGIYGHPGLLVLDDPDPSLTPREEYDRNRSICDRVGDKAVLFITERLSAVRDVDRIYLLKDGYVMEEGTHNELLLKNGLYRRMWKDQIREYEQAKMDY